MNNNNRTDDEIRIEAIKNFADALVRKIESTTFEINCPEEAGDYRDGCLFGLAAKQVFIIEAINELVKERTGE